VVSGALQWPGHDDRRKQRCASDDGAVPASMSDARAKGKVIQYQRLTKDSATVLVEAEGGWAGLAKVDTDTLGPHPRRS
jgi:hypothetical protein